MPGVTEQLSPEEIARRGGALYERAIRPLVEPDRSDWFLVLNVLTGEYVTDPDDVEAARLASARFGSAPLFAVRIGHSAAYHIGGRFEAKRA